MEKQYQQKSLLQTFLLIAIALFLATACTQETPAEHKDQANTKGFDSYSHDGLNLKHPTHWTLAYDESPSLYADRGVSFNTSEYSAVNVSIFKDSSIDSSRLADYFERRLRLKSTKHIENYRREPIQIEGFSGFRLTWQNTMFDVFPVELTILPIVNSPTPTFTVFHLLDKDIEKESPNFIPFINNVSIQ